MFQTMYTRRELRRRLGRTVLTASGLAAGVGLVIGITGVSQGLDDAQNTVLSPLKAVGTDILVTRVVAATDTGGSSTTPTTASQQTAGPQRGFFAGPGATPVNQQDIQALQAENSSVVTDLSKLGKPGEKFTHDFFLPGTLLSFDSSAQNEVAKVDGVASVVSGLSLQATHQTGTVPQIVAQIQTGGDTVEQTVQQSAEQRQQLQDCVQKAGGFTRDDNNNRNNRDNGGDGGAVIIGPGGDGGGGGAAPAPPNPAVQACFEKFGSFRARFTNPLRTVQQALNPPQTDITSTPYTAAGIDPAHPESGLVTRAQLTTGRWLRTDAKDEILISAAYATKQKLAVGSTVAINGTNYKVVGLVNPALQGNTADVYFPLSVLQELSGKAGRVNELLVKAKNSATVDKVAAAIKAKLPGAQVVTTKALADQVTGSLADAKKLSDRLGGALAVIVLVAAFVIASLLTLSSVAKRVREIGTLRAVGWSKRMVVRQVLMETIGIGFLGAALGVGLGLAALAAVGTFSPEFTASRPALVASSSLGQIFGQAATAAQAATKVKLHAPARASNLGLGVAFAALGGLVAGTLGGWRAARLQPAEALRDLG